jgi:hypothetical protein
MDEREREIRRIGSLHREFKVKGRTLGCAYCRETTWPCSFVAALSLLDKERKRADDAEANFGITKVVFDQLVKRNARLVEALEQQIGKQAARIVVNRVNREAT